MGNRTALFSRKQPGGVFTIDDLKEHPGDIFFVDSGSGTDGAGYGKDPDSPFDSIDYAVGQCTANQGDVIYVMPGHAETVTAGSIDLDVQGISVIGLGIGDDRPTLTFSAVDSDIDVDDCDIHFENFRIVQGINAVVAMFDVNSDDFTLENVEFVEHGTYEAVSFVDLDGGGANACDNFHMYDCKVVQRTAGADQVVDIAQVHDGIEIVGNYMDVDCVNGCIYSASAATDLLIKDNVLHNRQSGDHAVELSAAATGHIVGNHLFGDTLGTILDPGSCFCSGNLESDAIDQSAVPTPRTSAGGFADNSITADSVASDAVTAFPVEQSIVKSDGAVLNGADDLFTITGGPIMVLEFVGIVTTLIGGAANCQIIEAVTEPSGDVNLSTNVAIDNDAAGTSYTFTDASPAVLTPTTAGGLTSVPSTKWLCPVGTINATCSAAQDGVIAWYMSYKPLSPDSSVSAAA